MNTATTDGGEGRADAQAPRDHAQRMGARPFDQIERSRLKAPKASTTSELTLQHEAQAHQQAEQAVGQQRPFRLRP
ncbi:MAG: hypothetical protein WDN06_02500 [Asticcacaulis sp.]